MLPFIIYYRTYCNGVEASYREDIPNAVPMYQYNYAYSFTYKKLIALVNVRITYMRFPF